MANIADDSTAIINIKIGDCLDMDYVTPILKKNNVHHVTPQSTHLLILTLTKHCAIY